MKIDEGADRQHCDPCRNMDDIGKCLRKDGRTCGPACVESETCCHAEDTELVPRDEESQKSVCVEACTASMAFLQQIVVLSNGESKENEHEILACAADLCVGEAAFTIDNVGADAA